MAQNASEFQTWKSRPQLIHMQYAMLNEASGATNDPRLAKWQSIVVRARCCLSPVACTQCVADLKASCSAVVYLNSCMGCSKMIGHTTARVLHTYTSRNTG